VVDDSLATARLRARYASDVPCLPSRTALFSSRFGIHTGVVNHGGTNADPHETTDLARDRPGLVREGLAMLEDWTNARLRENATDTAGGSSAGPQALEDPLWRVIAEGGPYHTNGHEETYAERLRETGRAEHAEDVEDREGVVGTTVSEYLAGDD
jgi:choline-sulfatase